MWDDILLEVVVELSDANWHREKKKRVTLEEIKEDDIKNFRCFYFINYR